MVFWTLTNESRKNVKTQKRTHILHNPRFKIGVLALQGAYDVHAQRLEALGAEARLVRKPEQLERAGFYNKLEEFCQAKPVFGTCAGCILMAKEVEHPPQKSFGVLDIAVERNAYGRQNESTILSAETALPGGPLEMVFIRAPRISRVGPEIETLAARDGSPTLIRQGRLLAATFHPELTEDVRVHQFFLNMIQEIAP